MKFQTLSKLAFLFVLFSSSIVSAQDSKAPPMTVTRAWLSGNEKKSDAGFGDQVIVEVEHLAEQKGKIVPRDFVLFLDGQAMKGVTVASIEGPKPRKDQDGKDDPNGPSWLGFKIVRTPDSDTTWRSLLGSPGWKQNHREVSVSVGPPNSEALPQSTPGYRPVMYLRVYHRWWAVGSFITVLVIIGAFVYLAKGGHLIRDSNPPKETDKKRKPYSLALTQAGWWFFLVIGSFVFIYLVTGDYNSMTDQALILMGIGTGTALGAFMINNTKRDTADSELGTLRPAEAKLATEVKELEAKVARLNDKIKTDSAAASAEDQAALRDTEIELAEKKAKLEEIRNQIAEAQSGLTKPVSEGFRKDILTDVNGITLHRFQMVVWTFVLGMVFLIGVYRDLAMPQFSATLLALMGISAGTYLGFKIPERQTDPKDEKDKQEQKDKK